MKLFSKKSKDNRKNKTAKKILVVTGMMLALFMAAPVANNQIVDNMTGSMTTYAAESTFSQYWYQDTDGTWKVRDSSGNIIKNAWLCDDAVASNGQDVWYLLDSNGNMINAGLVQDQTGNYYSLETNHNGYFGMLRYKSGNYEGINLSLESSHNGGFAKILNNDGLEALKSKYGVTTVNIDNSNCVYTSTFGSSTSITGTQHVTDDKVSSGGSNNNNSTSETTWNDGKTHDYGGMKGGINLDEWDDGWGTGVEQELWDRLEEGLNNIR